MNKPLSNRSEGYRGERREIFYSRVEDESTDSPGKFNFLESRKIKQKEEC